MTTRQVKASTSAEILLEYRLNHWGKWRIKVLTQNLGYPDRCSISRIKEDGGLTSASTYRPEIPLDEVAEEMDELINTLEQQEKLAAQAIRIRYASLAPINFEIEKWRMSSSAYHNNVRLGKMWLLGRMSK